MALHVLVHIHPIHSLQIANYLINPAPTFFNVAIELCHLMVIELAITWVSSENSEAIKWMRGSSSSE